MLGYTDNAKNGMLGQLRGRITHLSLHTTEPDASGSGEVTGGGYTRAAVTGTDFTTPATGEFQLNADQEFDGPANGDCTHVGAWDGSDFLGAGVITGDTTFNSEGDFILKSGTTFDLNAPVT